jgi:hypothetical protein
LGQVVALASNIMVVRVEKVDKEKNIIIFRKVRDLKGTHNGDVIKHNIGKAGFHPREWQYPMDWAEVGKTAIFFHNGGASEMCIGTYWYQAYAGGEWWNLSHGEPFLLRSFAGNPEKLAGLVTDMVAGKEVIAPCMVDGNKEDLHLRRAKIQRLKVSLKLQDYNPKRDFVGWGGEDFRRLNGMAGFTHYSALSRVDPDAQAVSVADIDGDGKQDLCLVGAGKLAVMLNGGESLNEMSLPAGVSGCRAAVWADYNSDGKPDLLVATPNGPKLFTNLGAGNLRDDSHLLPGEPAWNLTAAAWLDYDGDGKPDILLGNGFHGLRLYRNKGQADASKTPLKLGAWRYVGPFDNACGKGFDAVYPPEKELNFGANYPGKNGEAATWKEGKFADAEVNNLALFKAENNIDAVVYLHREIECTAAMELPLSLGSDDTLTIWLNGEKLLAENAYRAAGADQNRVVLKLKAGKNQLLIKVCQGTGEWAFYFAARAEVPRGITWDFEDVSAKVGLGPNGLGGTLKGDSLTVCDVNGDGRPDFLYGAGSGLLALNTKDGFKEAKDSGISFKAGRVGPVFGDVDGDGKPDLFLPQSQGCKLFRNDGNGKFTDVTAKSGDLAKVTSQAVCGSFGDFDNDGKLDLFVGCLRSGNVFLRNKGDGTFEDKSDEIGLTQKVFNTQAIGLADLNGDGVLDVILNNEGQESAVLLGNPEFVAKRTPVTLQVTGSGGVVGGVVRLLDKDGKLQASQSISGGDGRGGQASSQVRFALVPGAYKVEVLYSSGLKRARDITVAATQFRGVIDDQTPKVE